MKARARRKPKDPTNAAPGQTPKYILNPEWSESKEEVEKLESYLWGNAVTFRNTIAARSDNPFAVADSYRAERESYFPGENQVPEEGAWVLVKDSPPTEYTVPPLSIWFAQPWPLSGYNGHTIHRVKIVTPRGDLGLFPHEYSKVRDISRYVGMEDEGCTFHFFAGQEIKVDSDALFYAMSRGVTRKTAMLWLLPTLRSPSVGWFRCSRSIAEAFGKRWPVERMLAVK